MEQYRYSKKNKSVRLFKNVNYDYAIIGVTSDNRAVYDYENMLEIACISANEHGFPESKAKEILDEAISKISLDDRTAPIVMYPADFK